MLPPDLTVEALYPEHTSHPRHPRLAIAMHRAHIMEHWATGTLRMVQACLDRGLPRPEFRSHMGNFMVSFRGSSVPAVPTEVNHNPRQTRALAYAREKGNMTRAEYEQLSGVSASQAIVDLNELVAQGLLLRLGRTRATHYAPMMLPEHLPPEVRRAFELDLPVSADDPSI